MTHSRKTISENLKALRAIRNMPQADLAAAAEIDRGYISSIENGRYSPTSDVLDKLAAALEVNSWDLMDPDGVAKYRPKS